MWIEVNGKLINLDQHKEIYITNAQFGGKCLVVDGVVYPVKNAQQIYQQIKLKLLEKERQ